MKTVGMNGESKTNNYGRKLTEFHVFNNVVRIMNNFCKHKDIHRFTWCTHGTK